MPEISKLVEKVVSLKKDSEVSLIDVEVALLPGRTALRNAALQEYHETFETLKSAIGAHTGGIFVFGPGTRPFAVLAATEGPSITLDAAEMYAKVAEQWFPTVRVDQVFAIDCVMPFLGAYQTILLAPLGIRELLRPDFGVFFGRPVKVFGDAVLLTRDIMRATYGDVLNGLYLNHRLAEEVVKQEWDLNFIAAVIIGATEEEVHAKDGLLTGLFYGHNITLTTKTDAIEKPQVLATFKRLANKLNPNTKPAPTPNPLPNPNPEPE